MPVVQRYGGRRVDLAELPGVRKHASETALSSGAGVAAAEGNKADALGGIAQLGMQISGRMYADLQQQGRDQADEVARLSWQNKLADFTTKTIYDPADGVLTVKGEAAMGLPNRVSDAYEKIADEIGKGLSNDRQRALFARDRAERRQSIDLTVVRHVNTEIQTYHAKELQATVENAQNLAVSNALDPETSARELARGAAALQASGPKLFGWGAEDVKKHVQDFYSAGHAGIIENLLTNDKTAAAKLYYADAKDEINGDARTKLEAALQTAGTQQTGLETATSLWEQLGPKGDTDPINLDIMEDAAREKFANDPDTYLATVKFLRERKAGVDASRQDRAETTAGDVWIAASRGATIGQVSTMAQFRALPGRQQAAVTDYIVSKVERAANVAAAVESREYTAESRRYTEEQRAAQRKETTGWARYWDLSSPATLERTSENALQAMRGDLGDDHVNRLLTRKRAIAKSDDTVRSATIDDDLFKTIAQQNGINAYGTLDDDGKADLGRLKNTVETAIDQAQQAKGKLLTRDEKHAIMQRLVDNKVFIDRWWGLTSDAKVAAMVQSPEDRAAAYVPIADIPAPALTEVMNYLRSLTPQAARLDDAEIRSRYTARIQRAYALRLLGATRVEMEAVLQGRQ